MARSFRLCRKLRYFILFFLSGSLVTRIVAFDYLEHSLFADRACHEAQKILAANMQFASTDIKSRYLALALMCPSRWRPKYCEDGKKTVAGAVSKSRNFSISIGDYAALADHITEYGRVPTLPGADEAGLVDMTWKAMLPAGPGGVVLDIGREGCRLDTEPDWSQVESDITSFFDVWRKHQRAAELEPKYLAEGRRAALDPGPADPSALFTIKNPRFLDLQLFNQTHFGAAAYRTWAGLHHTALSVASMRCEDAIDLSESTARKLAARNPELREVRWDKDKNPNYKRDSCWLLRELLRSRLASWRQSADQRLTQPVSPLLAELERGTLSPESREILDSLAVHVVALVFEGTSGHFMQDALSGGHVRTEHNGRALGTTRRYHDIDSKNGVVVTLGSREGRHDFLAFGDTYLLGDVKPKQPQISVAQCEKEEPRSKLTAPQVTSCLLGYQRGMVTAAYAASIVDWGLGGIMYNSKSALGKNSLAPSCPTGGGAYSFVCAFLPLQPIGPPATFTGNNTGYLAREGLPPTPPPVDFQSLRIESSLDAAGYGTQIGARLEFLIPFVRRAGDWLYSYDFGFLLTLGDPGRQQLVHEFAFTFHYRLATRLLINAGPLTYVGFEGFSSQTNFFFGTGLGAGVTMLPEGWTKIPLELTLSYRAPWRFVDTNRGLDGQKMEGHWVGLSVGLAFL